jgi:uncharacterized protein
VSPAAATPHLPRQAAIDAYGKGGFRFAGMSHLGSLLCLPDGVWAWDVTEPGEIGEDTLAPVLARAAAIDLFILGTGRELWIMPPPLRQRFRSQALQVDTMPTAAALRTYNVLFAENRRVAAALIAVA